MKPKRPTETDLLTLVQNEFNAQLPKDREAQAPVHAPAPQPMAKDSPAAGPTSFLPMVRITVAVPEDLRFRLKVTLMGQRRKSRNKMTQDEYCAKAIAAQLDLDEGGPDPRNQVAQVVAFLKECVSAGALTKGWAPKAKSLLESLGDFAPKSS